MVCLADYIRDFLLTSGFKNNYLEIGVFDGEIISEIAKKFSSKQCYAIDPFIEDGNTSHISGIEANERLLTCRENTLNNISNLTNVTLFEMTSEEFYNQLTDDQVRDMNIGCVVIDGDHSSLMVKNDIQLALKLFGDKNGVLIIDDWFMDSVRETALAELDREQDAIIGSAGIFFLRK